MGSTHRLPNAAHPPASAGPPGANPPPRPNVNFDEPTVITRNPPGSGSGSQRAMAPLELGRMLAGERLNHFELIEYVGGGGMGAVFRARDTMLGREVALKVLSRDQGADDETRRRFQNEAQSAARLDHENIARVYYVGEDRGLNYIVFEFIEGINLRDHVDQKGPLPLGEALSYAMQIAKALDHASSRDVIHRDIKPSNVLITSDGRAKLVDMGLARLHQMNAPGADLTASGVTLGTFDYISPEQARDPRSADVRSDLYSLGCTVYFMLTGRPPFPEGTVLQKLLQHNSDEPPDPREFNAELPVQVSDVVRRMLAKNPRRRYQTPSELMGDLLALAEQTGISAAAWGWSGTAAPPPVAEVSFVERHLPWIVPVALLLAAVVAIDVLSRPSATDHPPTITPRASSGTGALDAKSTSAAALDSETAGAGSPHSEASEAGKPTTTTPGEAAPGEMVANTAGGKTPAESLPMTETSTTVSGSPASLATSAGPASAADRSGAAEPPPAAPREEEPLRPGLLVVSRSAQGPQRFTSLRAACSAAKTGDVIELRYDGRQHERPILLNNLRFTIRAGEGYQPTIVFKPDDIDPLHYARSMITVAGGRLTLLGVAIELDLPPPEDVPADSWSMFALQRPESVELQACALTIRNRTDQVNFFHLEAAAGADSMMASDDMMPDEPAIVHLVNCVIRGEGVVLRTSNMEPVTFSWENGLAVTTERFLVVGSGPVAPRHGHHVRLALRHLTAIVGTGFCQLTNSFDAPYLRDTTIECADSILMATTSAPLIEQEGVDGAATFERQLSWHGDRNFYQGFDGDSFWRIIDQNDPDESERMSYLDWVSHWGQQQEYLPTWGEIAWKHLPPADRPMHARTPDDYALADETKGNMARDGASDGRDVGFYAAPLPPLAEEQPTPPADAQSR